MICTPGVFAIAVICSDDEAPGAIVPTVQIPVDGLKSAAGWLLTNVTPSGNWSVTWTPVAVSLPLLVTVTV